jgi:phosphatidylserine/phosphatidylglycerophosphate/cardiolipin synthase-like enzyme
MTSGIHNNDTLPAVDGFIPRPELGFGEKAEEWPPQITCCQKVRSLALPILLGVTMLLSGVFLGAVSLIPIAIFVKSSAILSLGAGIGAAVGGMGVLALAGFMISNRYRNFPKTASMKPACDLTNVTPLGTYNNKNSVLVTQHAKETFDWKLDLIKSAQRSIEISGNFCGGERFREALAIIKERLKENAQLKVHIIVTDSLHNSLLDKEDKAMLSGLEKAFPNNFYVLRTKDMFSLTPSLRNYGNHVKLVAVDEKYFVVGGTNFYHKYSSKGDKPIEHDHLSTPSDRFVAAGFRDIDIVGRGELAKTLRLEFFKLWAVWEHRMASDHNFKPSNRYFPVEKNEKCTNQKWKDAAAKDRVVKHVKMKALICDAEKPNAITAEYARVISQAKKAVTIANYTFNPAKEILQATQDAVKRKVKVSLVTNGIFPTSPPSHQVFIKPNHDNYLPLLVGREVSVTDTREQLLKDYKANRACVKIKEYAVPNIMYHAKVLIGDDTVIIGSYNLNKKSLWDEELNLTIESPEVAKKFRETLAKDSRSKLSKPVTFDTAYDNYNTWMSWFQNNVVAYFN